jgi:hypothetical protein
VFEELLSAAKNGGATTPGLFVRWSNLRWPGHNFGSTGDVFRVIPAPDLELELSALQAHLFSRDQSDGDNSSKHWDGTSLANALKEIRKQTLKASSEAGLPPLYPSNLSV